jgi:hypothetical protein
MYLYSLLLLTPSVQNLPDPYLRTLRNEPCNTSSVVAAIGESIGCDVNSLTETLRSNVVSLFRLNYVPPAPVSVTESSYASNSKFPVNLNETEWCPISGTFIPVVPKAAAATTEDGDSPVRGKKKRHKDTGDDTISEAVASLAVHDTKSKKKDSVDGGSESYYGCPKCRVKLFVPSDLYIHSADAAKTAVFSVGEEGLCKAMLFVACTDSHDVESRTKLEIKGASASCSDCRAKLGKFVLEEAACACGAAVKGPIVRIIADKVDFFDKSLDLDTLTTRMLVEAEETKLLKETEEEGTGDDGKVKKKKKEKIRGDNRANFSSYRNKDFKSKDAKKGKGDDGADVAGGAEEEEEGDDA